MYNVPFACAKNKNKYITLKLKYKKLKMAKFKEQKIIAIIANE